MLSGLAWQVGVARRTAQLDAGLMEQEDSVTGRIDGAGGNRECLVSGECSMCYRALPHKS